MNNSEQFLNPHLFEISVEQETSRKGFGEGLLESARSNDRVVGLCADLTESTYMTEFKEVFPGRFIQLGVAEQNLAAVASGMAAMGKIPIIASYAIFSPGRNWEQIRTTICYNDQNVKIVGSHAGLTVGQDGGSHQALEDLALSRVLPRMTVFSPCDSVEARKATLAMVEKSGPVYLRLSREKTPVITTADSPFVPGQANLIWRVENPKVLIVATGDLVYQALLAAQKLTHDNLAVCVLNVHTVKPLDEISIIKLARSAGSVVTVEDHQRAGGLGGAVSEVLSENCPVPVFRVGVNDSFGQSGRPIELLGHYGLNATAIRQQVVVAAKNRIIK